MMPLTMRGNCSRKRSIDLGEARTLLLNSSGKTLVLTTHKNADPDALASITTLYLFLKDVKAYPYIVLPEGLNSISKRILEKMKLKIDFLEPYTILKFNNYVDMYIVLDTSNPVQLGLLANTVLNSEFMVIDHHRPGLLLHSAKYYLLRGYVSTSEIIFELLEPIWYFSRMISTLLLIGILYDSKRFLYHDQVVFNIVSKLSSKYGADYGSALKYLQREQSFSERVAKLKAAKRIAIFRVNDYLIVYTYVGAHESSVANALINMGADVVFVASEKDGLRITARATTDFIEKTSISLGRDILPELSRMLNGEGGGHDTAGVVVCKGSIDDGYKAILRVLEKFFNRVRVLET